MALDLIDRHNYTPAEVCREFKIHRTTLYRNLVKYKELNKVSIKAEREKLLEEKLYPKKNLNK